MCRKDYNPLNSNLKILTLPYFFVGVKILHGSNNIQCNPLLPGKSEIGFRRERHYFWWMLPLLPKFEQYMPCD